MNFDNPVFWQWVLRRSGIIAASLVLILLGATVGIIAAIVILFAPPSSPNPTMPTSKSVASSTAVLNPLLGCRSVELYQRFAANFDTERRKDRPSWDPSIFTQEFTDNCTILDDTSISKFSSAIFYRIEKIDQGYACVRNLSEPQCYWTDASKLRYIGNGPSLSDEQYAQIKKLDAEMTDLQKRIDAYNDRADNILYRNGRARDFDDTEWQEAREFRRLAYQLSDKMKDLFDQKLKILSEPAFSPSRPPQ